MQDSNCRMKNGKQEASLFMLKEMVRRFGLRVAETEYKAFADQHKARTTTRSAFPLSHPELTAILKKKCKKVARSWR